MPLITRLPSQDLATGLEATFVNMLIINLQKYSADFASSNEAWERSISVSDSGLSGSERTLASSLWESDRVLTGHSELQIRSPQGPDSFTVASNSSLIGSVVYSSELGIHQLHELKIIQTIDLFTEKEANIQTMSFSFFSAVTEQASEFETQLKEIFGFDESLQATVIIPSTFTGSGYFDSFFFGNNYFYQYWQFVQATTGAYFGNQYFGQNYDLNYYTYNTPFSPNLVNPSYESQLKTILDINLCTSENTQTLTMFPFPIFVTDSAASQETFLIERFNTSTPTASENFLKELYVIDVTFALAKHTLATSIISTSSIITDQATARETQLQIITGFDFSYATEIEFRHDLPNPPTYIIQNIYLAILATINKSGIFGPLSADFVIDPDSVINWPSNPTALCLLEPSDIYDVGDAIGAGRFGKVWEMNIVVHVAVQNIYDVAYKDSILTTSVDNNTGPYHLVDLVIDCLEQAYLVDLVGNPLTIEFPRFLEISEPRRYKGSNNYVGLPLRFALKFVEPLPGVTPN